MKKIEILRKKGIINDEGIIDWETHKNNKVLLESLEEVETTLHHYENYNTLNEYELDSLWTNWKRIKTVVQKHIGMAIIFIIMMTGCSSLNPIPELPQRTLLKDVDPPKWVMKGSGAFSDDTTTRIFYGVGSASDIKNYSLQRMVSDDRARNDLAKVIEYYTKSLLKDYLSDDGALAESAIKTITSSMHHGVLIVDHWEHPQRNVMFSLAKLDLDRVKTQLEQYLELSSSIKAEIRKRANELHKELEHEVDKLNKHSNVTYVPSRNTYYWNKSDLEFSINLVRLGNHKTCIPDNNMDLALDLVKEYIEEDIDRAEKMDNDDMMKELNKIMEYHYPCLDKVPSSWSAFY